MSTGMADTNLHQSPGSRSSSSKCLASLHTSASVRASQPLNKKARQQKRAEHAAKVEKNRPHHVLGIRQGDDAKWTNSDLAKVLVTEEEITTGAEPQPLTLASGVLWMPRMMNYGVGETEKKMLFELLPPLTAERGGIKNPNAWTMSRHEEAEREELNKANQLARVLDLRNANAGGIAYENRRRIVAAFSEPGQSNDSGRPEVQGTKHSARSFPVIVLMPSPPSAALLTMKIRNLWDHLQRHRVDRGNRPRLAKMVHTRAKILKYLKKINRQRYDDILPRLGLEQEAVEGELIV